MKTPIITTEELNTILGSDDLIIIDSGNGTPAKEAFLNKHIQGALFLDLNTQLSDIKPDAANGGRHPLPTVDAFTEVLASVGITPESHVVIYDTFNGANAAARLWWMLMAVGHENVQVLSGGLAAAERNGLPTETGEAKEVNRSVYSATAWQLPLVTIDEVARMLEKDGVVIDVRSAERYNGQTEPIDLIAGHIPGAINIPLSENLDTEGLFKSPEELYEKYRGLFDKQPKENIAIHCGSGVTACHTLLAMAHAGLPIPSLYVGSWSEWSRSGRPMITKSDS